jgi:hypothetical protein
MLASTSTIKGSHKQSHSFFLQFSLIFQTFSFNFTEIVNYGYNSTSFCSFPHGYKSQCLRRRFVRCSVLRFLSFSNNWEVSAKKMERKKNRKKRKPYLFSLILFSFLFFFFWFLFKRHRFTICSVLPQFWEFEAISQFIFSNFYLVSFFFWLYV